MIPITNARDGKLVRLVGTIAYASHPLEAPLTGRLCAFYRAQVEEGEDERILRIEERGFCPELWIENSSGRALVEMGSAQVRLAGEAGLRTGPFNRPSPRQHEFLGVHKAKAARLSFQKPLHYSERILRARDAIVVIGLCKIEVDPEPPPDANRGYRQTPMRVRIVAPVGKRVLISDHPKVVATARDQGRGES